MIYQSNEMFQVLNVSVTGGETWDSGWLISPGHWWSVQRCTLNEHRKWQKRSRTRLLSTSRVEQHSLVTSQSFQSLLQRDYQWRELQNVTRGRAPGSNTKQKSLSQIQETFRIFPEHWTCLICLWLSRIIIVGTSSAVYLCLPRSECFFSRTSKRSDIFKTKYF